MVRSIQMGSTGSRPTEEITLPFAKLFEETEPTKTPSTDQQLTKKP